LILFVEGQYGHRTAPSTPLPTPIAPTEGATLRALAAAAAAAAFHSRSSSQAAAAALPSSSPAALAESAATARPPEASHAAASLTVGTMAKAPQEQRGKGEVSAWLCSLPECL